MRAWNNKIRETRTKWNGTWRWFYTAEEQWGKIEENRSEKILENIYFHLLTCFSFWRSNRSLFVLEPSIWASIQNEETKFQDRFGVPTYTNMYIIYIHIHILTLSSLTHTFFYNSCKRDKSKIDSIAAIILTDLYNIVYTLKPPWVNMSLALTIYSSIIHLFMYKLIPS